MPDLSELYRQLQASQPEMVEELRRYVMIESGTRDKAGVDEVGSAVAAAFKELGFHIDRISEHRCGDHLVARRSGQGSGRMLALIHLDTVWPKGTIASNPFRIERGRAYGPGVADMKGGWVVLLSALRVLQDNGWDGLAETTVFMTGDEEFGSVSGRPHIEKEARAADVTLVMEPARENGALVTSRGMVGAAYMTARGATAHTGAGDRGASAIEELAHKIVQLQRLSNPDAGVIVSVGTVQGGSARQVVPDHAEISIDVRAPSNGVAKTLMQEIMQIAEHQHVPGTSTELSGGITRPAFEPNSGTERLLQIAQQCGKDIGMEVEGAFTRAGSDGCFTAALGVPTLDGLGPESANVCSRDEYVEVDSLPRRAALLAGIIGNLPPVPERPVG
jgi:glutamate carboxypeptidase